MVCALRGVPLVLRAGVRGTLPACHGRAGRVVCLQAGVIAWSDDERRQRGETPAGMAAQTAARKCKVRWRETAATTRAFLLEDSPCCGVRAPHGGSYHAAPGCATVGWVSATCGCGAVEPGGPLGRKRPFFSLSQVSKTDAISGGGNTGGTRTRGDVAGGGVAGGGVPGGGVPGGVAVGVCGGAHVRPVKPSSRLLP